jgi:hypothetical protein
MLIAREDAKKMDLILSHLVKNETARMKLKQIQDLLHVSLEESRYLYESILKYHTEVEPVISIHHASNIAKRPRITEEFLRNGGFEAVYERQAEIKTSAQKNNLQLKNKFSYYNWQRKTYWLTFCLAILGFVLGLISLFISLKIIKID